MSELITAARPYARAAFEVARENNETKQWLQALKGLSEVVCDPTVNRLIGDPRCSREQIGDFIIDALSDTLGEHSRNFVRLLVANQRLKLAADITALFEQYRADAENTSVVEIVSAYPLDEAQQVALCRAVERHTGRKTVATCRTDEQLLGGATIRIGDFVVDGSLRTKLEKLTHTLMH